MTYFDGSAFYVPVGFGPMVEAAFQQRLKVLHRDGDSHPHIKFAEERGKFSGLELAYYMVHESLISGPDFLSITFNVGFTTATKAQRELDSWAVSVRGYDDSPFGMDRPPTMQLVGYQLAVLLHPTNETRWARIPLV